jgi:hypothetical protein
MLLFSNLRIQVKTEEALVFILRLIDSQYLQYSINFGNRAGCENG